MARTGENKKLTDKQEAFCQEYIKDSNGTQAAKRAGYADPTNENSLGATASALLRNFKILDRLAELRGAVLDKSEYGRAELLAEYKSLAHTNISDFIENAPEVEETDGVFTMKLIHFRKLPRHITAAVKGFKTKPNGEVEFTLYDKVKAMEGLGKHFGIFEADNKQKNALGIDTEKLSPNELLVLNKILMKAAS